MKIQNYILGNWEDGEGIEIEHFNAITGEQISTCSSAGLDYKAILEYGRNTGGPALRKMTFQERGRMLKALALHLHSIKGKFYGLSAATGATKIDSWIDIEGGIGNLFANASLRRQFPDLPYYVDGVAAPLSKEGTFIGHHIMVPKKGVAVHINAFNFPIWGMLEKIAVNLMAGVPAVVKPSEYTSYLTELMVKEILACIADEDIKYLHSGQLSKYIFPMERKEAHDKKVSHLIVRLFVVSPKNGEFLYLVQKRGKNKIGFPNYYTDSASGHVQFKRQLKLSDIKKEAKRSKMK